MFSSSPPLPILRAVAVFLTAVWSPLRSGAFSAACACFTLAVLLCPAPASAEEVFGVQVLRTGLFAVEPGKQPAPTKSDGILVPVALKSRALIREGDRLSAGPRDCFGIVFALDGMPHGTRVRLTVRLTPPEGAEPAVPHVWEICPKLGDEVFTGWRLSDTMEIPEGEWLLEVVHERRVLVEQAISLSRLKDGQLQIPDAASAARVPGSADETFEQQEGDTDVRYALRTEPAGYAGQADTALYLVQSQSFVQRANAVAHRRTLRQQGVPSCIVPMLGGQSGQVFRVVTALGAGQQEAARLLQSVARINKRATIVPIGSPGVLGQPDIAECLETLGTSAAPGGHDAL